MSEVRDPEATMRTGRLLGLFFGLIVLCAVFFAFGFTLGRSAVHTEPAASPQVALKPSGEPKPEAGVVAANDCPAGENCSSGSPEEGNLTSDVPSRDELTFYKAVSRKEPEAKLVPAEPAPAETPVRAKATPAAARTAAGGYTVQVAAVSKREDAEALASALRKKQYSVFTSTNLPVDKLVHVQVGPFATLKEAELMRTRLRNDGYNPILKK
jgi:DedD protein